MKIKKTKRNGRGRHYPVELFAFILLVVVFIEGAMFGVTTGVEFAKGLEILDLSTSFHNTRMDFGTLVQPLSVPISGIHQFYMMATEVTMGLLDDNIIDNMASIIQGVVQFYKSASDELASVLDLSDELLPQPAYAQVY